MPNYVLHGSFQLPDMHSSSIFDELPDGRLVAWNGEHLFIETALGSRRFLPIADAQGQYPSFLRVSPSGERIALGDGTTIRTILRDDPAVQTEVQFQNYDAEWIDEERLAVTGSHQGSIAYVLLPENGDIGVMCINIGSASGGVTLDSARNLYLGDGYDPAHPDDTGFVKAFTEAEWQSALDTSLPLDFKASGVLVADLLSAAYLGFDAEGNLHVGGGNSLVQPPEVGYAAVADRNAVAGALTGGREVDDQLPSYVVQRLDPKPGAQQSWHMSSNWITGELYVTAYGESTVYVYLPLRGLSNSD